MITTTRRSLLLGAAGSFFTDAALAGADRRISHIFGETVVRGRPTRVASLGLTTQDPLLALGVTPVLIRRWFGDEPGGIWPWARSHLAGRDPAVVSGPVSIEAVATADPDLIIGMASDISLEEYLALSRIAPVVMQNHLQRSFASWDDMTRLIGRAVGKETEADSAVSNLHRHLTDVRARHPEWAGKTAVTAYLRADGVGVYTPDDSRGRFLQELGFAVPEKLRQLRGSRSFYMQLSPEDLSPIDADLVIWIATPAMATQLAQLPMRRFLRAFREGREVLPTAVVQAALSFGSVLSIPYAAAALEADLAAALDGDPSTRVPSALAAGILP